MEDGGADQGGEVARKWLEERLSGQRLNARILSGNLQHLVCHGHPRGGGGGAIIRCTFVVPKHQLDMDGNWSAGSIAALIDIVGTASMVSTMTGTKVSADFNISYFSTAKINEELEVEAKVLANREKLSFILVEIRRKTNAELIALGKQWMVSVPSTKKPSKL